MLKQIKWSWALDKNGNTVHINDAVKGVEYHCIDPDCKKEFVLRKSGKTGTGSRRPHYAHIKGSNPTCTRETFLHNTFQLNLLKFLEEQIAEKKPFILNWWCNYCNKNNSGNLLEKVTLIEKEYTLRGYRPDIALLNKDGNVVAVIEVVVTHPPEKSALQYYKENKIVLTQITVTSEADLDRFKDRAGLPNIVELCLNPKCPNRDSYKIDRSIRVSPRQCNGLFCRSTLANFDIMLDTPFGTRLSKDFTEDDINWVSSRYENIKTHKDPATKEKFPYMFCEDCQIRKSGLSGRYRQFRF